MNHFFKGFLIGAAICAAAALASPADAVVSCRFTYYDVVQDTTYVWQPREWKIGMDYFRDTAPDYGLTPVGLPPDIEDFQVVCRADGPELWYIRQNFTGLRDRKRASWVNYTGDEARFLYHNLSSTQ